MTQYLAGSHGETGDPSTPPRTTEFRLWPRDLRFLVGDDGSVIGPSGRALRTGSSHGGYRVIGWYRPAPLGRLTVHVHVMVCETFHGPRPAGHQAAHGNGDPVDNRAVNLRWATVAGNAADRIRHGTQLRGVANPRARLTERDVRVIRRAAALRIRQRAIAERYGISVPTVQAIIYRRNWRHVA